MKPLPSDWKCASIPQLARLVIVAQAKVHAWIDSGELVARNIATTTSKRPIFRIDRADFERFWQSRATTPPVPAKPASFRRRSSPVSFV